MRNLKKVLSLALALVMLLGMMVIGAGAAYTDADAITKTEAVDVMTALGIFEGSNGVFDPQGNLRREQAAKIVVYVSAGPAVAKALGQSATPFEDVTSGHWASGFVAYCSNLGIITGMSATRFDPRGELTAAQFAKMLLVAMGGNSADYDGNAFFANTPRDAIKAGLNENVGVINWNGPLTREQACQMAMNALTKTLDGGKVVYPVLKDGKEVMTFNTANEAALYAAALGAGYTPGEARKDVSGTLGEQNYGLKSEATVDKLGNPATKWTANGDVEVIVASTAPTMSVRGEDFTVAKTLKNYTNVDATDIEVYYNGSEVAAGAREWYKNMAGKYGVTLDFYCKDKTIEKVVVTEPYLAKVTAVANKTGDVTLKVYEAGSYIKAPAESKDWKSVTIKAGENADSDYALVKDMAKGDVFMGVFQSGWEDRIGKLVSVAGVPEALEGKVTATRISGDYDGTITIDGTRYPFANEYSQAVVGVKDEGTFYLYDGNVYHFEETEVEDSTDYAVVVKYGYTNGAGSTLNGGNTKTYQAKLILTDGSEKVVDVNKVNSLTIKDEITDSKKEIAYGSLATNVFVSYTEKDGVYALKTVGSPIAKGDVTGNKATYTGTGESARTANAKTVFIVRTAAGTDDEKVTIYNGIAELPSMTKDNQATGDAIAATNGIDTYVYLNAPSIDSAVSSKQFAYIIDKTAATKTEDGIEYDAIVGGELTTLLASDDSDAATDPIKALTGDAKSGMITYTTTGGVVNTAEWAESAPAEIKSISDTVLVLKTAVQGSSAWQFDSNTVVYIVEDGDVVVTDMDDVTEGEEGKVFVEFTTANTNLAVVIWVIR